MWDDVDLWKMLDDVKSWNGKKDLLLNNYNCNYESM
jgi:hypothetical protein